MAAVAIIGVARLLTLGLYPLADNTESRYAEIGRVMAAGGDWITPRLTDGRPFWAKPPLSTWLTAGSLKLFGVNEFAARLPYFLLAALVVWLTFALAKKTLGRGVAWLAAAVLCTSALTFVASGAVMTDLAMVVGTTLAMVGFWLRAERRWALAAFAGVGIALLGKGPVGVVLLGVPLVAFLLWSRSAKPLKELPWLGGVLLALGIAAPWYAVAERNTPGFLNYFIVGEHISRFVNPGWKGDLYGTAHVQPKGMIWLYALGDMAPWSFVALTLAVRQRERLKAALSEPYVRYLVCWALTPLVFFTLAGNILYTYVLPGLPAFAILLAWGLSKDGEPSPAAARGTLGVSVAFAGLIAVAVALLVQGKIRVPTDKALVEAAAPRENATLLYFSTAPDPKDAWKSVPPSAGFYSGGNVRAFADPAMLYGTGIAGVVVEEKQELPSALIEALAARFGPPESFGKKRLYRALQK